MIAVTTKFERASLISRKFFTSGKPKKQNQPKEEKKITSEKFSGFKRQTDLELVLKEMKTKTLRTIAPHLVLFLFPQNCSITA